MAPGFVRKTCSITGLSILLTIFAVTFSTCASTKANEEQAKKNAAEIEQLQTQIQSLQSELADLKAKDQAQIESNADAEARADAYAQENKELKANIARLEALLNDFQTLQLSLMMGPLQGQDVTSRDANPSPSPSPEAPSPSPEIAASPIPTPSPSPSASPPPSPQTSPSPSPSASPTPEPSSAPSPSPTVNPSPSPTPSIAPSPSPRPRPSPSAAPIPSPAVVSGDLFMKVPAPGRSGRAEQKPTVLIAETDRASGKIFYYHKDAWYDRPGIFVEILRSGKDSPQAVLRVLRRSSELPNLFASASQVISQTSTDSRAPPTSIPAALIFASGTTAVSGTLELKAFGIDPVLSFSANLDQKTMIQVIGELIKLDPVYSLTTLDQNGQAQSAPDAGIVFAVGDKSRKSLFEMMSAYRDMVAAPK